jgi:hypothetical protein
MAEHIWTVLCERHLIDPDSKIISLIDVGESLNIVGLQKQIEDAVRLGKKGTFVNVPAELVSWWYRSDTSEEVLHARFVLRSPAGKVLMEQPVAAPWGEDKIFTRVYLTLNKFPVSGQGLHWLAVEQEIARNKKPRWVQVTRLPLFITEA